MGRSTDVGDGGGGADGVGGDGVTSGCGAGCGVVTGRVLVSCATNCRMLARYTSPPVTLSNPSRASPAPIRSANNPTGSIFIKFV